MGTPTVKVQLAMNDQHATTCSVEHDSVHISWQEHFDFLVFDERQVVNLSVVNSDLTGKERTIGSSNTWCVADLVKAGPGGCKVTLEGPSSDAAKAAGGEGGGSGAAAARSPTRGGELVLTAKLFHLSSDSAAYSAARRSRARGVGSRKVMEFGAVESSSAASSLRSGGSAEEHASSPGSDAASYLWPQEGEEGEEDEQEEEADEILEEVGKQERPWLPSLFTSCTEAPAVSKDSPLVALLACEFKGGGLPAELGEPGQIQTRVRVGSSEVRCATKKSSKVKHALSEKTVKSIQELQGYGMEVPQIAQILGENLPEVTRLVHKGGMNFEVKNKAYLLLRENDIRGQSRDICFDVLKGKQVIADGRVSLQKLAQVRGMKLTEHIVCMSPGGVHVVKMLAKLHLFNLCCEDSPKDGGADAVASALPTPSTRGTEGPGN
mmetsp:Transcript_25573/g.82477  ORF Transcript_25573/g.82477 Transcript_25573/m.82477 type:complete len:436 (-) Transcript_25573:48-1355(-)